MIQLLGIPFDFTGMTYYQTDKDIEIGESVIVTTPHGTFLGKVLKLRTPSEEELQKEDFETLFPKIERIASYSDKALDRANKARAQELTNTCQKQADDLNLGMKVISSYFDCYDNKALITFTSEGRVDFRELVKILSGTFHLRIELRQIGPRDQARLVGGIGPCGLPLCCTTFLNSFDGISINMAKNQLLAINIPKLSGQCGKLMCCLRFEDEAYSQLRPLYPKIGEKFDYNKKSYTVTGLNLLTDTITTYNGDSYESFTKEEFERVKKGLTKQDEKSIDLVKDVNSNVDLSGHGIRDTKNRIAQINRNEEKRKEEVKKNFTGQKNQQKQKNQNNQRNNPNNKNTANNNQNFNKNNPKNNNQNNNRNNQYKNGNNPKKNNPNPYVKPKSSSGFIPVSQIQDKSVLDFKPVKNDDSK